MNENLIKLIPKMTSNTSPSGIASASGTLDVDSLDAWKAFDGINETSWSNIITTSPSWLKYDFLEPKNVIAYSLKSRANAQSPKNWTFEGSNDENTWTVLDTQVNQLQTSWSEERFFYLQSEVNYSKYRINITAYNSTTATNVLIYEFNVYKSLTNKFLILSNDESIISIEEGVINTENVIPVMTSDNSPSGEVQASGFDSGNEPFKAMDRSASTYWRFSGATGWIYYKFDNPIIIDKYSIQGTAEVTATPKDWTFEGSNDGIEWDILDINKGVSWIGNEIKYWEIPNGKNYLYYRINITANNGLATTRIRNIEMFEAPSPNIYKQLTTATEANFIIHGMDKNLELDMSSEMTNKVFIEQSPITLGNGKVFSKTIDTTKTPIKKVSIK